MDTDSLFLSTIDPQAQTLARRWGLGLEIAEYCTAYNMDERFAETDALVRSKLDGLRPPLFHAPFNELFPCAIDPKARELARQRYCQALRLAETYRARKVIIHGGYHPLVYYPVWYVEQSILFWQDFLRELPGEIPIVLENVLEEEPEMLADIVRGVDDPRLRLCLDVGHVNAYSRVPVQDWLEALAPWINHFHIHNNDGTADTHSALTQGTLPMKPLLEQAQCLCPAATYTLELMEGASSVRFFLEEGIWNNN